MLNLIKITREGASDVWDEHFKTILLLLLETLGDNDGQVRALALRVLREILRNQPTRFKDYAELTILKILESHKDSEKEVSGQTLAGGGEGGRVPSLWFMLKPRTLACRPSAPFTCN